ncbi:MAG: SH3-like domain-containing protein, partial [Schleiferilactobacillus harbinensis]|nr:SH3-like domain-containing protein [Schleiferilactobacillus harbinensis]
KLGLLPNGKYDVQAADYDVAIVSTGRNDGTYRSVPTKPGEKFVGFGMAKFYDSQLGHVTETVTINGTKWVHVTVAGQAFWMNEKGTGKVTVTTRNEMAIIDQSSRNDGLYKTIGTVTGTNFKGANKMAQSLDGDEVTLVAEVTVGKTTWAQIKLQDKQLVWIDKAGLQVTRFQ